VDVWTGFSSRALTFHHLDNPAVYPAVHPSVHPAANHHYPPIQFPLPHSPRDLYQSEHTQQLDLDHQYDLYVPITFVFYAFCDPIFSLLR